MSQVNREHIEELAENRDSTPDPGWEKMEEAARQAAQQNPPVASGDNSNPNQPVPEDERLQRPVATETDSY